MSAEPTLSEPCACLDGGRAPWGRRTRVALALSVLLALLGTTVSVVSAQEEIATVTPGQLIEWCEGLDAASADQTISGCTVLIEGGQSSTKTLSYAHTNRGDAHRSKGDYELALDDFNRAIMLDAENELAYNNRAYTQFYKAEFAAAATDLARSIEIKPSAYPMLWHFLARSRAGESVAADSELAAHLGLLQRNEWPYPVIEFYLGRRSATEMSAAAGNDEERCEAQFYLGEWHLLRHDGMPAATALQAAADTCPRKFYEYDGAVSDLARLAQK